jgi:hypothetical protein
MKTIDLSARSGDTGKGSLLAFLSKLIPGEQKKQADLDAQNEVIFRMERVLGDEFTLIRDIHLPGLGTSIPMALVGPPGVFVLYPSAVKGTYRARADSWLKLDSSGNMKNSSPNLPHRTRLYAEAIRKFLTQEGFPNAEIEPVLLFTQTEAFVENIKAPIRMVMCDGLESYGGSLRLLNPTFTPEEQASVIRLLSNPEGKASVADEIAAAQEQIVPQPVIMPSEEPVASEPVQEAPLLSDDMMRSAFAAEEAEPAPIEIPPVIEEAVEQAPGFFYPITSWLARTHMSTNQITILGAFAMLDLLVICLGFAFVLLKVLH